MEPSTSQPSTAKPLTSEFSTSKPSTSELSKLNNIPEAHKKLFKDIIKLAPYLVHLKVFPRNKIEEELQKVIDFYIEIENDNQNVEKYIKAIAHQIEILKIMKLKADAKPNLNSDEAIDILINNVRDLYLKAIKTTKDDDQLHLPYVLFCIQRKAKLDVIDFFSFLLLIDFTNEKIWKLINDLYFHSNDSIKAFMWDAMPDVSERLISEISPNLVQDPEAQSSTNVERLLELFCAAFKYLRCSYFHISLLNNIKNEDILKTVVEWFQQEPFMWNVLAQQVWRDKGEQHSSRDNTEEVRNRLIAAIVKYKHGIDFVEPENKLGIWRLFLGFLISVYEDPEILTTSYKYTILKTYLEEGSPYLEEYHFMKWLKLEKLDSVTELKLIKLALSAVPTSGKIWSERLKYEINRHNDYAKVRFVFDDAIAHAQRDHLMLWEEMISYTVLSGLKQRIEDLFWEASRQHIEVSSKIRPLFLEWLMLQGDMKKTRTTVSELMETEPHSKEMYLQMCKLECMLAMEFDIEQADMTFHTAIARYPFELDLRLGYIQFIFNVSMRDSKYTERIKIIHDDCKAIFPPDLYAEFEQKLDSLKKFYSV